MRRYRLRSTTSRRHELSQLIKISRIRLIQATPLLLLRSHRGEHLFRLNGTTRFNRSRKLRHRHSTKHTHYHHHHQQLRQRKSKHASDFFFTTTPLLKPQFFHRPFPLITRFTQHDKTTNARHLHVQPTHDDTQPTHNQARTPNKRTTQQLGSHGPVHHSP